MRWLRCGAGWGGYTIYFPFRFIQIVYSTDLILFYDLGSIDTSVIVDVAVNVGVCGGLNVGVSAGLNVGVG